MIKKIIIVASICLAALLPLASRVHAQTADGLSLTIAPPFFELNVNPGDAWASSIRVVNTNGGSLPVRASVVGFMPSDEAGHGTFVDPGTLTNDADALANWIVVSNPNVTIPRGGAIDLPFSVVVPKDAAPGGHYAAILIGTTPAGPALSGSHVGVSSFISALVFVRVSGDIKEEGSIKEFSTDQSRYDQPNVNFKIRFANMGNVHIRPVGQVEIFDAFGKSRGVIDINQTGNLGYVLPSSTREFDVTWQNDLNLLDIGQYTAVATFSYGDQQKKTVSRTTTFWILPIANILEILFVVFVVAGGLIIALKWFVRKMLSRELTRYGGPSIPLTPSPSKKRKWFGKPNESTKKSIPSEPHEGVIDLRKK